LLTQGSGAWGGKPPCDPVGYRLAKRKPACANGDAAMVARANGGTELLTDQQRKTRWRRCRGAQALASSAVQRDAVSALQNLVQTAIAVAWRRRRASWAKTQDLNALVRVALKRAGWLMNGFIRLTLTVFGVGLTNRHLQDMSNFRTGPVFGDWSPRTAEWVSQQTLNSLLLTFHSLPRRANAAEGSKVLRASSTCMSPQR
jgi:hypothetical protein